MLIMCEKKKENLWLRWQTESDIVNYYNPTLNISERYHNLLYGSFNSTLKQGLNIINRIMKHLDYSRKQ